jgi:hypothetical protein
MAVHQPKLVVYRKHGEGLLTTGVCSLFFAPLNLVAPGAAEKAKAMRAPAGALPGVAEQYAMQVKLLEQGTPDIELLTFPGFLSTPSALHSSLRSTRLF